MVSARTANARRTSGANAAAATPTYSQMATPAPLLVRFRLPPEGAARNGAETVPNGRATMTRVAGKRRDSSTSDGDDTSDSSSSGAYVESERCTAPRVAKTARTNAADSKAKPRPVAYSTRQKQEKEALLKEVEVLEAQVDSVRGQASNASVAVGERIKQTERQNRCMEKAQREQLLSLHGMRSVLSQHLRAQFWVPVSIPIRLGKDPVQRHQELLSSSRLKLDTAYRFLEERFRGVDGQRRYQDREMWTSPEGDFCVASSDVMLFHGVQSVKQVYDALQFYMVNMEISISEVLGQLTIREDINSIDTLVSNHRLISSTDHGIVVEVNTASYSEYFENFADHGDEEFALFASDFVTEDELFPYCPQERVRKNISGTVSLRPLRSPENGEELVVVMRRSAFLSIEKPQFPVSDAALADLEHNVGAWGDVMIKSMRDVLYTSK